MSYSNWNYPSAVRIFFRLMLVIAWATIGYLWWRSGQVMDEWSVVNKQNTLRAAVSFRGAIHFIRAGKNASPRKLGWDTQSIPSRATIRDLHANQTVVWEKWGFMRISTAAWLPPPARILISGRTQPQPRRPGAAPSAKVRPNPPPPRAGPVPAVTLRPAAALPPMMQAVAPWLLTYPYDVWVIPYWAAFVVVSLPWSRPAFVALRRVARRRRGRCANCGYDLRVQLALSETSTGSVQGESNGRASPSRCPECGTIPATQGKV